MSERFKNLQGAASEDRQGHDQRETQTIGNQSGFQGFMFQLCSLPSEEPLSLLGLYET